MKNLAEALVAAQGELHNLSKDAQGYGYEYLTLPKLIDETRPVLQKHGLAVVQRMAVVGEGQPAVCTMLLHKSGESIEGTYPISAVTMKQCNDAQQLGAAVTYARRYSLAALLNICADTDNDAASIGSGKPKQQQQTTEGAW